MKKGAVDVGSLFMSKDKAEDCDADHELPAPVCTKCSYVLDYKFINPFTLFDLPVGIEIDRSKLDSKYFELQRVLHPDKMFKASDQQKDRAEKHIQQINDHYKALGNTLERAKAAILAIANQSVTVSDFQKVMQMPAPTPIFLQNIFVIQSSHALSDAEKMKKECLQSLSQAITRQDIQGGLAYLSELTYLSRVCSAKNRSS